MTNEEAISKIKAILEEATETEDAVCYVTSVDAESLNLAIEALEKQNSKYYELGKKIMEDVQNALLYGTKGKKRGAE